MFVWRKDRAVISDEEPTFHVRYLGCTETYTPVGPGCTARYVQKLWDNAPSERHLKRVAVKLGLGGIWMKGVVLQSRSGDCDEKQINKARLQQENIKHVHSENGFMHEEQEVETCIEKKESRKRNAQDGSDKKTKAKSAGSSVSHFKMEDVSFCAADKSANDRIFCWISRWGREAGSEAEGRVGPFEVHAVLCSTVDKAQTMAAVMSRAFQLAYKDWRAVQQRENRRQQQRKISSSDSGINSGKIRQNEPGAFPTDEEKPWSASSNEGPQGADSYDESGKEAIRRNEAMTDVETAKWKPMSTCSSSSSLSSAISQHSIGSSQNNVNQNRPCTCAGKRQDNVPRQEISIR